MRITVLAVSACALSLLTGCLSAVRIPVPVIEDYSDEGVCTNRVWRAPVYDIMETQGWRAYPATAMRCAVTRHVFSPIDRTKKGEDLWKEKNKYWGAVPLAILWATAPIDAAVDTAFLPFDLYRDPRAETVSGNSAGEEDKE